VNRNLRGTLLIALLAAPAWRGGAAPRRPSGAAPVLTTVADFPLPGTAVRFDYQSLDIRSDRLYIAHMGAGQIVVFNVKSRSVEATIDGVPGVTGVWAVPSLGRVYASVTRLHHVAVIDDRTLQIVAMVGNVGFPDGIAYAPDQQKVYVSDESGGGELVIDAKSNGAATLPLDGEAGNTVFDPGSRCILVAVQSRNQLYVIDPRNDRILGRFDLQGAARPHGMAIDAARRLAFVANERDGRVLMVDLKRIRVVDAEQAGDAPDVLAFDPGWRRLYVATESGVVSVFTETSTGLAHEGDVAMPHAHTVAVDPRTHLVYFPLQDMGGRPVLRIMAGTPPAAR
jgi:DNA-binding beta-propeller fold protein YncE